MKVLFNINGQIVETGHPVFNPESRIYRYGDGFFESMKLSGGLLMHSVLHWERIRKSAMLLKMQLEEGFEREQLIERIEKTAKTHDIMNARIRCNFLRESAGFYTPLGSSISLVIEIQEIDGSGYEWNEQGLVLGAYQEMTKNGNFISTLKTTSALIYVMAGLYAKEHNLDECVIFNDQDRIAECITSNIFMVSGEFIITPPISEYCVDGVMRKVVMNLATAYGYSVLEQPMSEVSLTSADEVFLTSATRGIRWVATYKGKMYRSTVARILSEKLNPGV